MLDAVYQLALRTPGNLPLRPPTCGSRSGKRRTCDKPPAAARRSGSDASSRVEYLAFSRPSRVSTCLPYKARFTVRFDLGLERMPRHLVRFATECCDSLRSASLALLCPWTSGTLNGIPKPRSNSRDSSLLWPEMTIVMFIPCGRVNLSGFNSGKHQLLRQAQAIVAAAVEPVGAQPAKVAHPRQRQRDQPIEKLVHPIATQRHLAADRHAFAELEIGDRVRGSW